MLPFMLDGKTILITGASSGIGRGIALACAESGAKCILVGRNFERLNEVKSACAGEGHRIEVADMTNVGEIKVLVDRLPVLDGAVQSAGVSDKHTPLKFLTSEFIDQVFSVNVKAPMLLLSLLVKKKKLNNGGSVVLISSISSFRTSVAHSLYAASKGAVSAFTKGAALDLAGKKIRVNSIAPGMINTPFIDYSNISQAQREADLAKYPLKRYGEPSDVAGCAVYLLSDVSEWITGQQFVVDGGTTIQ